MEINKTSLNKSLTIRQLKSLDAPILAKFIGSQSAEYLTFFYAFGADEKNIANLLGDDKLDIYSGVFWQGNLIGIFILRGWDEGYKVPAYGALIDEKYRGKSIFGFTLDFAKIICKLSGIKQMMCKVHPDNLSSINPIRRNGFYETGIEEKTGNIIFHMDL